MNLDNHQHCPECGAPMQVCMPIWVTPGDDTIDTGNIDWESSNKNDSSKWLCPACDYAGFPVEAENDEEDYVVPESEHWKEPQ